MSPARWARLVQLTTLCGRNLRRLVASCDERLAETDLLVLLLCESAPEEGLSQVELAELAGVSAAQISGVMERLRGESLVDAFRPRTDRRRQHWRLNAAGRSRAYLILREIAGRTHGVGELVSPTELKELESILERMIEGTASSARKEAA